MDQTRAMDEGPLLLVVDDDENARAALVSTMATRGYRVLECATGLEAVATLQAGELPRLILLDLLMPVMDGWEFRLWLLQRRDCADIPVIVMSGVESTNARGIQADAFLPKPLAARPLLRTVDALLSRQSADPVEQHMRHLGQHLADTVRPMRFSSITIKARLEAAVAHLHAPQPNHALALGCVERALASVRSLHSRLTQAELFAYRNYGLPQALAPRVLLVDDEEPSRLLLAEALDALFNINVAASAREALMTLMDLDDYDVVVCRLCLAGMSGADLIERLAETRPEQARRILFLSSETERAKAEEARLVPYAHLGILREPVTVQELHALIANAAVPSH